jgi:hypothetical protein
MKNRKGVMVLVVFAPDLKVAFRVAAHRAFFWGFAAFEDETAVSAFPFDFCVFLEDFAFRDVCQQLEVSAFMVGFYFGDAAECSGYVFEAFLFCYVCEVRVKCSPFEFFAFSGCFQVFSC